MAVAITQSANTAGGASVGNTVTWSAASIGTADANRIVVVCCTGDTASLPQSATIGGVAMTATANGNFANMSSMMFYLEVPTGTSADIAVTFSGTVAANASAIVVYAVTGARGIPIVIGAGNGSTDSDASTPLTTGSITIPTSGGFIGAGCIASNTSTTTWANATVDVNAAHTGAYTYSTATRTTALTTTAVTLTGSVNNSDGALQWLVFGPGSSLRAAYSGTGTQAQSSGPVLRLRSSAAFAGTGALAGDVFKPIYANFAGVGTLVADGTAGRPSLDGVAAFAGVGTFIASQSILLMAQGTTTLASAGALIASNSVLTLPDNALFTAAGNLAVSAVSVLVPRIATFAGIGGMSADVRQFVAGVYDETGSATATDTLTYTGKSTELEFGLQLDFDNLTTGDTLEFRVYLDGSPLDLYSATPLITVPAHAISAAAAFSGIGALIANASILSQGLTGTAAFIGVGNFNIVPTLRMLAQSTLAGTGAQNASAVLYMQAQEALVGAGTLFANLTPLAQVWQGTATFVGVGNFIIANSVLLLPTNITLAGTSNLISSAIMLLRPTVLLVGEGAFSITGAQLIVSLGATSLQGVGTLSIIPTLRMSAAATTYPGVGILSANATRTINLLAERFSGSGSFIASNSVLSLPSSATFAGVGTFIAANSVLTMASSALFAGAGTQVATPILRMMADTLLAGVGTLFADLTISGRISISAAFIGAGLFSATARLRMAASAQYAATDGAISATATLRMRAFSEIFDGVGTIAATATFLLPSRATFAGIGIQIAAATIMRPMFATFAGASSFVSTAKMVWGPAATYAGVGTMTATTRQRLAAVASYTGDGQLVINTPVLRMRTTTNLAGLGALLADLLVFGRGLPLIATFVGESALTATANMQIVSAAQFAAEGFMAADVIKFVGLGVVYAGTGYFISDAQLAMAAEQGYSGEGRLFARLTQITTHTAAADRTIISDVELRAITSDPELRAILTDEENRDVIADVETRTIEASQ